MKYKLVVSSDTEALEVEVNEHLVWGWQLHGAPFTTGTRVLQALVKEDGG